jgi:uncharacterized repeat protein (TIGR03803 family)
MSQVSRRSFLQMASTGLAVAPLAALQARAANGTPAFGPGFGPLTPRLPLNTAEVYSPGWYDFRNQPILALPKGFEYRVISGTGQPMSDGTLVPGDHDGMAAFRGPRGTTVLVRNHELGSTGSDALKPRTGGATTNAYDPNGRGGTTTLVLDSQGRLVEHYASVAGTFNNCAGGLTPWDSWVTCEETTVLPPSSTVTKPHGYNFEVPALARGLADPVPLTAMGRFAHEAIAVDPVTGYVYQTEDVTAESLFYRFVPETYGNLRTGSLWAMKLKDMPQALTYTNFRQYLNQPLAVEWVRIDVADPQDNVVDNSTRRQGWAKGAARVNRGEGCWYGNGKVYFVSTNGGNDGGGQVFAYDPGAETLTLVVECVRNADDPLLADNGGFVLAAPDNVTVGPDGRLYLNEDGGGVEKVVGVNFDGELYEVARNVIGGELGNGSEFCGSCFSHDGRFMFVNIQSPGITCVIRGPWSKGQR